MANKQTCIVCGKPFNADGSAQTCSLECFESFCKDDKLGIASEGANLFKIEKQHNPASGKGGWFGPLKLTGSQPAFDPAAASKTDRTRFIPNPRECPECGSNLSIPDGSETSKRPLVCYNCNSSLHSLKPVKPKLQIRKTNDIKCHECGSPLARNVNGFGFEGQLECIKCGLVH